MRLFLNHDITFFAQFLSELTGEYTKEWDRSFSRVNCFALPEKNSQEIPLSFSVASAVNILLAELTLQDKVLDSSGKTAGTWKWLKEKISPQGMEAVERLKQWRFPVEEIFTLAHLQYKRENTPPRIDNSEKLLQYYSEFTAGITGLIFKHAAGLSGRTGQQEQMFRIGFSFGSIVYLLDALEDFEKDRKQNAFNAVSASFGYGNSHSNLSPSHRFQVREILLDYQHQMIANLEEMPVDEERIQLFSHRLRINLRNRLSHATPKEKISGEEVAAACGIDPTKKKPFIFSHIAPVRYLRRNRFLQASLFVLSIPYQYGLSAFAFPSRKKGPDYSDLQPPGQQQGGPPPQQEEPPRRRQRERQGNSCCICCCDCGECCLCADCCASGGDCSCGDGCCCDCGDCCDCCDC